MGRALGPRKLTNSSTLALSRCALATGNGRLTLTLDDLTGRLFSAQVAKSFARLAERLALEPEALRGDATGRSVSGEARPQSTSIE